MKDWQSQSHVKWECKYHVVILPKYRKKRNFKENRRKIGKILRELCRQKGIEILEGNAASDHIHLLLSVPPKYSIAMTMGYLKKVRFVSIVKLNASLEHYLGEASGHEAIVSVPSALTNSGFGNIFRTRKNMNKRMTN